MKPDLAIPAGPPPSDAARTPPLPAGAVTALLEEMFRAPPAVDAWPVALRPGQVVSRFELVREIGRGGFGVVWEARDLKLKRAVAFKALRAVGAPERAEARLLEEAEAAARLAHPNIVTVYDAGVCEHGPYLVLEHLRGESLATRLGAGPLPVHEALRVAVEVSRAAAHAHAHGVVHRDLTPRNVFLCGDGRVKVLDFGLARVFGTKRVGGGTPGYMAPEQARGAPEDERSDVFALGALLYQMLTGELPFPPDSDRKLLPPSRPAALEVPEAPALTALLERMLAKDPVRRPADGAAVVSALEGVQRDLAGLATGTAPTVRRRRRWWRALAALALAAAGAVALLAWQRAREEAAQGGADGGRVVVAVADLANRTGDPELDALSGLLITSLEQSHRIAVLTRSRMLDLARQAGRGDAERVDETLGREICRRAAARALLVGAVHRIGGTYAVELRALDPERDAYLFTLEERAASKDQILAVLDRLSARARAALREPPQEIRAREVKLAVVVTDNLEAYRHYALGRDLRVRLRFAESVAELRKAVALDPAFALGHYELARAGAMGEESPEERARHEAEAVRLQDRLPERERRLLHAWRERRAGHDADAEQAYRALAADFPNDVDIAAELGAVLYDRSALEEAAAVLERALALDPSHMRAASRLQLALGILGRVDHLAEVARRAHETAPSPRTRYLVGEALLWQGRWREAMEAGREVFTAGESQGYSIFFQGALRAGAWDELRAVAAALGRGAAGERVWSHAVLAAAELHRGRRRAARAELDAMSAVRGPDYPTYDATWRLALLLGAGDGPAAEREAARLARLDPRAGGELAAVAAWAGEERTAALLAPAVPRLSPDDPVLLAAARDARAGRFDRALPALADLSRRATRAHLAAWLLAEASLAAGNAADAAAAARRLRAMVVPSDYAFTLGRAGLVLARAEEALGRGDEARAAAAELAELWRDADPDYPPAAELRALRARLGP
jgi:tetratricopeptide (TPR) repeat protein